MPHPPRASTTDGAPHSSPIGAVGAGQGDAASWFAGRIGRGAVLAPMAGFTDAPFRRLCRHYGAVWAVTEMVSAKGLSQGRGGEAIAEPYPGEPDVVVQLFAADADLAASAVERLERTYRPAAFDLNMGCPVKKVVNRGCGSELLRDPPKAAAVVAAMVAATGRPVSAKLRLGIDRFVAIEVAQAVVEAGAVALAVHGRTAVQRYGGVADWDRIAEVAAAVPVPVSGSGDVTDAHGYASARERGLGVMIARGSLGRPWVFAEVLGRPAPEPHEVALVAWRHVLDHVAWYGGEHALRRLRAQLGHYAMASGGAQAVELRAALVRAGRPSDVAEAFAAFAGIDPRRPPAGTDGALAALVEAPPLRRGGAPVEAPRLARGRASAATAPEAAAEAVGG
jgi:tRNA-dihydrouridine synthase B